jgi:HEAT repeat protein/beta-lactamase regulating signal transducer with metallopeptidase domain
VSHFVDLVVEPVLWLLASWSLRWAVLIGVFAVWLVVGRPRRAATRYLVGLMVLLAGLSLVALPRWGPGWRPPVVGRICNPASLPAGLQIRPTDNVSDAPGPERVAPPQEEAPVAILPAASLPSTNQAEIPATDQPSLEPLGTRRVVLLGLGGLWSAGVLVLFIQWLVGWLLLERLRRQAVPVQGMSAEQFTACRAALGLRRPAILATHPEVRSPITLGLFRPAVLVPPTWPDLPEHVQQGGLLHELAHLARRDDWLALLLELVRAVLFFHLPLLWLLARLECERELLCDEAALRRGTDPHDYVRMLLEFSRRPGRLLPAALAGPSYPLRFGKRQTVKTRIHHLLEENMEHWMSPLPARRAWALGVLVLGLAAGLGCVRIQASDPEEPEPTQADEVSAVSLDRPAPAEPPAAQDPKPAAPPVPKADLTYGGKSFEQWRTELVTELKPEVRIEGIKALSAFGANGYEAEAAQAILDIMKGYDVTLRNQDDDRVIAAALEAVRKIGPAAQAPLVAGLKDPHPNERRFAVTALSSLRAKAALPALIEAMKDKDVEVRYRAIRGVARMDPQAPASILALAGVVKDDNRNLRLEAMNHLANNASKAKAAVPALVEALQDEDPEIKRTAVQVLTVIGVEAKAAVPALLKAGTDKDDGTRKRAVDALAAIEPEASQVVPLLARAVKDKSQAVRMSALNYLEKLGPAARDAVPALVDVLKHGDPREGNERVVVVRALGAMGPAAKEAIPVLTELLKDNFLRAEITRTLSRITQ